MQKLVFGINGGGTFSRMRVEKNGKHLGTFHSKGTNLFVETTDNVKENLLSLFKQVQNQHQIQICDYSSACIGSAGIDRTRKQNTAKMQNILQDIGFNQKQLTNIDICSDGEILLAGAFGNGNAKSNTLRSILISGTGSIAIARVQKNEIRRFGGFGHVLGDEGSAYWIAIKIFSAALQDCETRQYSMLSNELMAYLGEKSDGQYRDFSDIIPYVHSLAGKSEIAEHAQILSQTLIEQCPKAKEIAQEAAQQLYLLFMRLYNTYPHAAKRLKLDGSVFANNRYIREYFQNLCPQDVAISLLDKKESAEIGACLLAENASSNSESVR